MSKKLDLVGQRYGRLVVLNREPSIKYLSRWRCKCDCGNEVVVYQGGLRDGTTQSCGCLQKERTKKANTKHGDTYSPLHRRYRHMIYRCENPNSKDYKNYGGRGIKVCEEWKNDYVSFKRWAEENGYQEDLTIDRIDVNGDYEPSNCRWIPLLDQENNRTNNVFITYDGVTKTVAQWARLLGVKPSKIYYQKRKGLSDEDVLRHFPIEDILEQMRSE